MFVPLISTHLATQPFWNAVVARMPMWVAANMLTLVGMLVNIACTLVLVAHVPDLVIPAGETVRCVLIAARG